MVSSNKQQIVLVSGPSRSGKSEWAESLAIASEKTVVYVATARENPEDSEWQARIFAHQQRRPSQWHTLPVPRDLPQTLLQFTENHCLLVDALGTWVANGIELPDSQWQREESQLLENLNQCASQVIFVGEEVGWGVVPAYALGRTFRDRQGRLLRLIGARADANYLVTGGYAIDLCRWGQPLPAIADSPS